MPAKPRPIRPGSWLALTTLVMDDVFKKILTSAVASILFFGALFSYAIEFEHISLAKKAELERQFEAAKLAAGDGQIEGKKWLCDMFGVRSRMQVQRNVKLYSLKKDALGSFSNSGAQVVSSYTPHNGTLQGKNERFEDQLRLTTDGQLLSRLSLRGHDAAPTVIAYSICRVL